MRAAAPDVHGGNARRGPVVAPVAATPPSARFHLTRALASRNYRLFFSGQSVSLTGTWITRIATSWLVYRLTRSALLLALVSTMGMPYTVLMPMYASQTPHGGPHTPGFLMTASVLGAAPGRVRVRAHRCRRPSWRRRCAAEGSKRHRE